MLGWGNRVDKIGGEPFFGSSMGSFPQLLHFLQVCSLLISTIENIAYRVPLKFRGPKSLKQRLVLGKARLTRADRVIVFPQSFATRQFYLTTSQQVPKTKFKETSNVETIPDTYNAGSGSHRYLERESIRTDSRLGTIEVKNTCRYPKKPFRFAVYPRRVANLGNQKQVCEEDECPPYSV